MKMHLSSHLEASARTLISNFASSDVINEMEYNAIKIPAIVATAISAMIEANKIRKLQTYKL